MIYFRPEAKRKRWLVSCSLLGGVGGELGLDWKKVVEKASQGIGVWNLVKGFIIYLLFRRMQVVVDLYTINRIDTWSFAWSFTIYLIKSLLSWSKDGDHQLWSLNIGRCTCFLRKPLIIVWKLCFDQKNVCCHHLTWTCIKTLAGWPKAHQVSGKGMGVAQRPQIWLSRHAKQGNTSTKKFT